MEEAHLTSCRLFVSTPKQRLEIILNYEASKFACGIIIDDRIMLMNASPADIRQYLRDKDIEPVGRLKQLLNLDTR